MNPRLFDPYDAAQRSHFRQRNSLSHGQVTFVDDSGPVQGLQYEGYPTELRDAGHYGALGLVSVPLPGSTAVLQHQGGYRGLNTALAIVDGRYRPTGNKGGESVFYMVDGANPRGAGGTVRTIIQGLLGWLTTIFGATITLGDSNNTTIVIGSNGNTATVDVYSKTKTTFHGPAAAFTNGGTLSPVMTEAGPSSVLSADG
jgi:phage gp45-like